MPTLQTVHGRIVDLRHYTNAHLLFWHRPPGPSDRYELWIKPGEGVERKFIVNTRTMPARQGHEVSLIVTAHKLPQLLGLANWTTIDGVNYARSDAPSLLRVWEFVMLPIVFLLMVVIWGDIGMVLFVPAAVAYLLMAGIVRAVTCTRLARQVDRAIDLEAWRTSRRTWTLH